MRWFAVSGSLAAASLVAGALGACVTAKGASYAEALAAAGVTGVQVRIVVLRPDQRYDDASLSRMVIRIDDRIRGKLAYGGFLLTDVPEGERILQVSADNLLFGICTLVLRVKAGETLYFDASPRPANIAAGAAGAVVAGMPRRHGRADRGRRGSAAVRAPIVWFPCEPSVALGHLERLRASE